MSISCRLSIPLPQDLDNFMSNEDDDGTLERYLLLLIDHSDPGKSNLNPTGKACGQSGISSMVGTQIRGNQEMGILSHLISI